MDPKLLQQIEDYLKASGLSAAELKKRMDDVKASTAEFNRELLNSQRHVSELNRDFNDLSSQFKNIVDDLKKWDSTSARINKSYKTLGGLADKLKYDSEDISRLSKKDLESLDKKARVELSNLKARKADLDISVKQRFQNLSNEQIASIGARTRDKNLAKQISQYLELSETLDEQGNLINDGNNAIKTLLTLTQERLKEEEKINQTLGITGKLVDGIVGTLGKLGIESSFFENLKEDMRDAAKSGDRWAVVSTATKGIFKGIGESLKDPVTQLTILVKLANFFFKAALTANAESVELGKSLGYGADRANAFRESMVAIERSSNNLNVTTANLTQAFGELAAATGFAYGFTADQLETQIKLTKQVGLTAEEAANIQKFSLLTGKTSEQTYKSFVKGLNATSNQLKVGINFKATLAEALKVSGQLSANLGNDPIRIAKAIVQAKAFGMTLEQTSKAGESLLNFESSIENELKAELLTGKQLNLERARAAALQGDQVTLAEELAKNVGTAADFTKMNVLQQKALAESVGMTSDELADTLVKREQALASGKSLAQVTEEERIKALERQNVQDKFNAAVEKLQSLFGNLLAGPLGGFLDMLSGALDIVNKLGNALSFLATPLKIIAGLYAGIKATQLTLNGLKAIETGILVKQAATEGGKLNIQNMQYLLGKQSLGVKISAYAVSLREIVAERTSNMLKSVGNLLGKKGLLSSIGSAIMNAVGAVFKGPTGFLGPFALPIALATGAAVGAMGYKFLSGDDVMSEGGYGKRTLLSPEGAIKLNDKDTVIAGTNLGGGNGNSMPQIDLTPMISAINEVRAAVDRLYGKDQSINMDSKKVGSTLVQGSYKMA